MSPGSLLNAVLAHHQNANPALCLKIKHEEVSILLAGNAPATCKPPASRVQEGEAERVCGCVCWGAGEGSGCCLGQGL